MRQPGVYLSGLLLLGCGGWNPPDWVTSRRTEAPSCDQGQLIDLLEDLGTGPVQAPGLVEGLSHACVDVLSPELLEGLQRWSGTRASEGKKTAQPSELPPSRLCMNLSWETPLAEDRSAQMGEVFKKCKIAADGLFDLQSFQQSSGPFGGLVASRLFADLTAGGVPSYRAVGIAQLVSGDSSRVIRSVYGDHSAKLWRVPLIEAGFPRVAVPGCTPTVVADNSWVRWQDLEWVPLDEGKIRGLVVGAQGPPHLESLVEMGPWQSSQESCNGAGKTILVALDPDLGMHMARPLLWTLDGLYGYRPALLARSDSSPSDALSEATPMGALPLRMVDVEAHERKSVDSLFLLPETRVLLSGDVEDEETPFRGLGWLPGLRLEVDPQGWRLFHRGEVLQSGKEQGDVLLSRVLDAHGDLIRAEGMVLSLSDNATVAELVQWLERLQVLPDSVMLDSRPPRGGSTSD